MNTTNPSPLSPFFFTGKLSLKKGMRLDSQSSIDVNICAILLRLRGYVAPPNL